MNVVINGRSIVRKQQTGIGRSTYQLLAALGRHDSPDRYICYAPLRLIGRKTNKPAFGTARVDVVADYFGLGLSVAGRRDVYHAPSIEDVSRIKGPIVVTVHDVIHKALPQTHTAQTRDLCDVNMKSVAAHARMIVCSSEHTRQDVVRFYNVDPARTRVVHLGVDETVFVPYDDERKRELRGTLAQRGLKRSFVLFVGTIEPRKNLSGLLKAFSLMKARGTAPEQLVIVGGEGWLSDGIESEIAALGLRDDVLRWGRATDQDLCSLYNLATVYAYPSLYEGFGLPILEAFSCRVPVVTSLTTSCGEIAGTAALTVDPADVEALAAALSRCVTDPALCATLVEKGTQRLRGFSFENMARSMAQIYREVV